MKTEYQVRVFNVDSKTARFNEDLLALSRAGWEIFSIHLMLENMIYTFVKHKE